MSSQSKMLRNAENLFYFFYFLFFIFTFDMKTKLDTFLIGFSIFIFKLCFTASLICADALLSLFFFICLY